MHLCRVERLIVGLLDFELLAGLIVTLTIRGGVLEGFLDAVADCSALALMR